MQSLTVDFGHQFCVDNEVWRTVSQGAKF